MGQEDGGRMSEKRGKIAWKVEGWKESGRHDTERGVSQSVLSTGQLQTLQNHCRSGH